ncbi:MAG: hypothetical protein OER90_01380 [Gemmatimonadota bacterium]|nr:hypothetical protein [Gemmatimonadota bacterium]
MTSGSVKNILLFAALATLGSTLEAQQEEDAAGSPVVLPRTEQRLLRSRDVRSVDPGLQYRIRAVDADVQECDDRRTCDSIICHSFDRVSGITVTAPER